MIKKPNMTDAAVLTEIGTRLARVRLQQNLTQAKLAREAGISKRTLVRLENGESSQVTNLVRVIRALGLLHNLDALVPPPRPSPIEQLRSQASQRKRASPAARSSTPSSKWTWGGESSKAGGQP